MAETKTISATFITAPFILSYPKLVKAEPYMEKGKPKGEPHFSLEGISTKESLAEWIKVDREGGEFEPNVNIEVAAVQMCKQLFGDINVNEAVKLKALSWPFKAGDKKAEEKGEKGAHYRGKKFWRAKAKEVINGQHNEVRLYVLESDGKARQVLVNTTVGEKEVAKYFYGGAICTAELNLVVGETAQGRYATFYVNSVIFNKDGDRLGGESNISRFYGVSGGAGQSDPTAGAPKALEDEIPY